jgi:hypothetical protein
MKKKSRLRISHALAVHVQITKRICENSFSSNSTVAIAPILVSGTFLVACQQTRKRFLMPRKNIFRTSATCCYLQGWARNFKNVRLQKQNAICKPRAQYALRNCAFKLFKVHCPTPRVDTKWRFQLFAKYDYRFLLDVIIAIITNFFAEAIIAISRLSLSIWLE